MRWFRPSKVQPSRSMADLTRGSSPSSATEAEPPKLWPKAPTRVQSTRPASADSRPDCRLFRTNSLSAVHRASSSAHTLRMPAKPAASTLDSASARSLRRTAPVPSCTRAALPGWSTAATTKPWLARVLIDIGVLRAASAPHVAEQKHREAAGGSGGGGDRGVLPAVGRQRGPVAEHGLGFGRAHVGGAAIVRLRRGGIPELHDELTPGGRVGPVFGAGADGVGAGGRGQVKQRKHKRHAERGHAGQQLPRLRQHTDANPRRGRTTDGEQHRTEQDHGIDGKQLPVPGHAGQSRYPAEQARPGRSTTKAIAAEGAEGPRHQRSRKAAGGCRAQPYPPRLSRPGRQTIPNWGHNPVRRCDVAEAVCLRFEV